MSKPRGIEHPCPWPYWRCECGWEDIERGEARQQSPEGIWRTAVCPHCGRMPFLCADSLSAAAIDPDAVRDAYVTYRLGRSAREGKSDG